MSGLGGRGPLTPRTAAAGKPSRLSVQSLPKTLRALSAKADLRCAPFLGPQRRHLHGRQPKGSSRAPCLTQGSAVSTSTCVITLEQGTPRISLHCPLLPGTAPSLTLQSPVSSRPDLGSWSLCLKPCRGFPALTANALPWGQPLPLGVRTQPRAAYSSTPCNTTSSVSSLSPWAS